MSYFGNERIPPSAEFSCALKFKMPRTPIGGSAGPQPRITIPLPKRPASAAVRRTNFKETVNSVIDLTKTQDKAPHIMSHIIISLDSSCEVEDKRTKKTPKKNKEKKKPASAGASGGARRPKRSPGLGECAICLETLGRRATAATRCGHVFCLACLERALAAERRCPACRQTLKGATAYHQLYLPTASK